MGREITSCHKTNYTHNVDCRLTENGAVVQAYTCSSDIVTATYMYVTRLTKCRLHCGVDAWSTSGVSGIYMYMYVDP